jgi:hypothetical protein
MLYRSVLSEKRTKWPNTSNKTVKHAQLPCRSIATWKNYFSVLGRLAEKLFLRLGPLGGKTISPSWAAWRAEAPLALRQGQEQTMASLAQQLERNVTKRPKCGECKHADHLFSTSG